MKKVIILFLIIFIFSAFSPDTENDDSWWTPEDKSKKESRPSLEEEYRDKDGGIWYSHKGCRDAQFGKPPDSNYVNNRQYMSSYRNCR